MIRYKRATIEDLEALVKTRVRVLLAANKLDEKTDMSIVDQQSREYYAEALRDNTHTAYLVYDGEEIIGAGSISYYRIMPTYHNQSGREARIMNMYTAPDYRRRGIAFKTLELLVEDARERGLKTITLEATDMGRPVYEKYGFKLMEREMELLLRD